VAIALGSNVGHRERHLQDGLGALASLVPSLRVSSFFDTAPVGVGAQPRFLNAAVAGASSLPPDMLLDALLDIERRFGRTRPFPGAPRTLDLDLILYGNLVHASATLTLPHPRFRERSFVLAPLAEVAGDWVDPVTGLTVMELLTRLKTGCA
jgi:2-amino-4-hydroxy-6-hydroxymethyldihydropteridine diphosphokinase